MDETTKRLASVALYYMLLNMGIEICVDGDCMWIENESEYPVNEYHKQGIREYKSLLIEYITLLNLSQVEQ